MSVTSGTAANLRLISAAEPRASALKHGQQEQPAGAGSGQQEQNSITAKTNRTAAPDGEMFGCEMLN